MIAPSRAVSETPGPVSEIDHRAYGGVGPAVVLLHGGPGAPGSLARLARGLERAFRVFEPFQRRRGTTPLSVDRHLRDLDAFLDTVLPQERPLVVGHSWGAMLGLMYVASRPDRARALALVGCGTFDVASRATFERTVTRRLSTAGRRRLETLDRRYENPDDRMRAAADLLLPVYNRAPTVRRAEVDHCDARGHDDTWRDALRRQSEGLDPASFAAIEVPVCMFHGDWDPHPGRAIHGHLSRHVPDLSYRELARCGHDPWLEPKPVAHAFFEALSTWLFDNHAGRTK